MEYCQRAAFYPTRPRSRNRGGNRNDATGPSGQDRLSTQLLHALVSSALWGAIAERPYLPEVLVSMVSKNIGRPVTRPNAEAEMVGFMPRFDDSHYLQLVSVHPEGDRSLRGLVPGVAPHRGATPSPHSILPPCFLGIPYVGWLGREEQCGPFRLPADSRFNRLRHEPAIPR